MSANPAINSAIQFSRQGNHAAAERVCRQILAANPADVTAWCHLGTTCLSLGRFEEAAGAYEQALRHQPVFPEALNNLGVTLMRLGRIDASIAAFSRAAQQKPDWAEPFISLGNYFTNQDRSDEAIAHFQRAVDAEPANFEAHNLLASALGRVGLIDRAKRHFLESIRLNPRFPTSHSNLLMLLNYDDSITPSQLLTEHRWWQRLHGAGLARPAAYANTRDPDRPLRIGYVSPDFRRHVVPAFMLPVLASHDRSRFEIFGYAHLTAADDMTERIKSLCSHWRPTAGRTTQQMIDMIRADRIDILIDLAGHTGGNRLDVFSWHPAPIQASYLGYPNTTGLDSIDVLITDATCDPPDQPAFTSEKLVQLPRVWCCYRPPENAPPVNPLPSQSGRPFTFGCMHKLPKLNGATIDLWSKLLLAVPQSRLLIFRNTIDASIRQRLHAAFAEHGIDPSRIEIAGGSARNAAHLSMYHQIDISLDALPWSGHGTTCESLWMGVPMLSLRGDRHAGRMSASILTAVGLADWIAETPDQFIAQGAARAADRESLASLRADLRARMQRCPLLDAAGFTRDLESAYRSIWQDWCRSAGR